MSIFASVVSSTSEFAKKKKYLIRSWFVQSGNWKNVAENKFFITSPTIVSLIFLHICTDFCVSENFKKLNLELYLLCSEMVDV